MGIRPEKKIIPISKISQDVLEETEMIFQVVRKNVMQAHINYNAYFDKKALASKLRQAEYVYLLLFEVDHQGSKVTFSFLSDWTSVH